MQVGLTVRHQPLNIGLRFGRILTPRNSFLHLRIEALYPNFELQTTRWEACYARFEAFGQMVGYQFKVNKKVFRWVLRN